MCEFDVGVIIVQFYKKSSQLCFFDHRKNIIDVVDPASREKLIFDKSFWSLDMKISARNGDMLDPMARPDTCWYTFPRNVKKALSVQRRVSFIIALILFSLIWFSRNQSSRYARVSVIGTLGNKAATSKETITSPGASLNLFIFSAKSKQFLIEYLFGGLRVEKNLTKWSAIFCVG